MALVSQPRFRLTPGGAFSTTVYLAPNATGAFTLGATDDIGDPVALETQLMPDRVNGGPVAGGERILFWDVTCSNAQGPAAVYVIVEQDGHAVPAEDASGGVCNGPPYGPVRVHNINQGAYAQGIFSVSAL